MCFSLIWQVYPALFSGFYNHPKWLPCPFLIYFYLNCLTLVFSVYPTSDELITGPFRWQLPLWIIIVLIMAMEVIWILWVHNNSRGMWGRVLQLTDKATATARRLIANSSGNSQSSNNPSTATGGAAKSSALNRLKTIRQYYMHLSNNLRLITQQLQCTDLTASRRQMYDFEFFLWWLLHLRLLLLFQYR